MALKGICVISARGGSEGVPGKNIRTICGKPLIAWSIEQAILTPEINRVVVSTDSQEIAKVAEKYGADVPFIRPAELSNSTVGKFAVWKHAFFQCQTYFAEEYDYFVDLDCTNPLRDCSDISLAIKQFLSSVSRGVDAVFTICEARKNPYFNLVEIDDFGRLNISKSLPNGRIVRRQDAPRVYEHVASIYVLSPEYLASADNLLSGYTEGYLIDPAKSFDIDSELDFMVVEHLLSMKLNSRHD